MRLDASQASGSLGSQAAQLLASMNSLGISSSLCEQVGQALQDLQQLQQTTISSGSAADATQDSKRLPDTSQQAPASLQAQRKIAELEGKLETSRSIMRKLYYRNVELEKELQLLQASSMPMAAAACAYGPAAAACSPQASGRPASEPCCRPSTAPALAELPLASLQGKEQTILELRGALDAARRRSALLEERAMGVRDATAARQRDEDMVREAAAQSSMHMRKYRQIREDYNRLLTRRSEAVQRSNSTNVQAKEVVQKLRSRLAQEIEERETEAAIYSAKLYETERQMSDGYVEKRMLEEHIARLTGQIRERDQLDGEIETCVAGLFERVRVLEAANEQLSKAAAAGTADCRDGLSAADGMPDNRLAATGGLCTTDCAMDAHG